MKEDYIKVSPLRQRDRSRTQLTIGTLLKRLYELPSDSKIVTLYEPHSYRGYYDDIAFHVSFNQSSVADMIKLIESCIYKTYHGYKGGEFKMKKSTPVWISNYGCLGLKLTDINENLKYVLKADD